MSLYNVTGQIGTVITGLTTNVTGNLFLTYLMVITILILIGLLFRISLEWQTIIIMPLLIGLMAFTEDYIAIGGVALIFLGVIFAKSFMRNQA